MEDRPLKIKAMVFPYRSFSPAKMDGMLNALAADRFIRRYQVGGERVIQVVNFLEHQSPHSTEKDSQLEPEPQESQQDAGVALSNASITQTPPNSSESGIRNQESVNQGSGVLSSDQEIFAYWQRVHEKPKAQFTVERKRKVKERLADSTVEEIKQAIDGCKKSSHHQGINERGTVYDDLELICRTRTHLEKFIGYTHGSNGNGINQQRSNGTKQTPAAVIANRPYR